MSALPHISLPAGLRTALFSALLTLAACIPLAAVRCLAQTPAQNSSSPINIPAAPDRTEAARYTNTANQSKSAPVMINGRAYVRPTPKEQFHDYLKDTYGWPGLARTSVRAVYAQGVGKPEQWGQDWRGFGQRFGSAAATTAIDGNVRYGLEMLFKEDMRYIPCHGCSKKKKLENALLAEITARHDSNGRRFFTLTPTISDMTGPIIANSYWVPGHTTIDGFVGSRLIFVTRIGGHLFAEFALERRHHDAKLPD